MKRNEFTRRKFLGRVGQGMLMASLGSELAKDIGMGTALAEEGPKRLTFSDLEPLVSLMQDTPVEKLQSLLVGKLKAGDVDIRKMIQAAALANARCFGGEDYVGMHTLMAFNPAYEMARQLPEDRRALVALKVLYRNTHQLQNRKGGAREVLYEVSPADLSPERVPAELLRQAVHDEERGEAEKIFASMVEASAENAFNDLLHVVEDDTDVHRVVFAHRSWEVLDLVGMENAQVMLRQSLRYCLKSESWSAEGSGVRELLPRLLDEHGLLGRAPGDREPDDDWVEEMSRTLFEATPDQAAAAVALSLAEGISPESIGEAISLATNQLVLRDAGRAEGEARPGKPEGSVHGDSIGVHASDSTSAWRGISRVSNHRNAVACLILAGYQAARDRINRGGDFLEWEARPYGEQLEAIKTEDANTLLRDIEGAIGDQDQATACALVHRYGALGHEARPVREMLLRFATSEDGALHAEKYYLTTTSDFATARPAFRWRYLTALARVTASEAGQPSPGYAEACELLEVPV
jgi:hypothetical protein